VNGVTVIQHIQGVSTALTTEQSAKLMVTSKVEFNWEDARSLIDDDAITCKMTKLFKGNHAVCNLIDGLTKVGVEGFMKEHCEDVMEKAALSKSASTVEVKAGALQAIENSRKRKATARPAGQPKGAAKAAASVRPPAPLADVPVVDAGAGNAEPAT
jgi:hypothetical protein